MSAGLYEVLALGLRYWFVLLGVIIVLRSFFWLRRDRREQHRRLRRLPDAGTVGELVVVQGSRELPEGAVIAVPWEGVLGFNRMCDIVVPADGVAACHLDFSFEERRGLLLSLRRGLTCEVDGQLLTHRSKARKYPMLHGSTLTVGEAVLKLRVFAGIDVEHHVSFAEDVPLPPEQTAPYVPVPGQPLPGYPPPWQGQQPASWQAPPMPPVPPAPPQAWQMPPAVYPPVPDPAAPVNTPAPEQPLAEPVPTDAAPALRPRRRRAGRRDADA